MSASSQATDKDRDPLRGGPAIICNIGLLYTNHGFTSDRLLYQKATSEHRPKYERLAL